MKFKKLTAGIVAAVMAFTAVATPLGDNLPAVRESASLTAGAVSDYNPTAAVNYAAGHWNDGVGKCASFVSACLKAGGCGASSSLVSNLLNALTNGGYGTRYKVTASSYYAYYSQNKDKLAAGDPVFFYCSKCGGWQHTAICSGYDGNGRAMLYGHNVAWNNKTTPFGGFIDASGHSGSCITVYSFHMNTHTHSYGSWYTKTSATCTSGGTEERKCSCGVTESRSTSALGHNYGSTYFEADHPHKYAHLCQRCGYKEFTGGNLDYYEKCWSCYYDNNPEGATLNITASEFKENSPVTFTWNPTERTTHYNISFWKASEDGEYTIVDRQFYVESGYTTTFSQGNYKVILQSYNSNLFFQFSPEYRDWIHTDVEEYFNIECDHEFREETVEPTYDSQGYRLHTCNKCGYSFQDDFVPALSHNKVTGLRAKARYTNSLILAWDENEDASGYEIEQYRDGDWQCIETIYDNTEVSYKVDDLRADTTYTFRIRPFVCIQDYNSYGEYTKLAAKTRIPNVTGLTSKSISSSTITLSWNKNNKATGYVIEQYKGGKWSGIATAKNNTTLSFTVKGLETDTTYTFRVKAYRTVNGKTEYSEYRRIQKTTAMDNVTGFKVKSTTSNSVTLTWNKTDRTTDYKIEQYKGGKWVDVDYISNEKSPVYTVTGLAPDTTYTFRIMALKITCIPEANNNSDYVRVAGKTRISNAAKFAGTALSNSAIKLVWSKNNMATGYVIEQYKGGKWTVLATTKNNTTLTFTVKGLAEGTAYSFRIKSFRKTGSTTEFSEYMAIKAATLLDGVSNFKVASTTGSWITLEWAKNDKATGYVIEQYKGGKWTAIATTKNNTTLTFTVKGLAKGTTYSFRIKSFRKTGSTTEFSEYTAIKAATLK